MPKKPKTLKMSNLLQIEVAFLRNPAIATALNLQEIRTIQRSITNSKKKKFEQSLSLSKHVKTAFEWFKSLEGQRKLAEEGITWTSEDFSKKVFGWQKSFFYKMLKTANVPSEVVEQYNRRADELGEDSQRSVEELLSFAKEVESGNESAENSPRAQIVLSLVFNHPDGKTTLKIDDAGQVKITGQNIDNAVNFIINSLNSLR